jgi:hypothetical protein
VAATVAVAIGDAVGTAIEDRKLSRYTGK